MIMLTTLNPTDKAKLKGKFDEISNAYTRIEAERDLVKEIFADIKDEFEIIPKVTRKLARIYHKRNLQEVVAENEEVTEAYDQLFS
jgi:hypothetical protein